MLSTSAYSEILLNDPLTAEISARKSFLITGSEDLADLALRGGDFGAWNYGRGIFLEAGCFIGL